MFTKNHISFKKPTHYFYFVLLIPSNLKKKMALWAFKKRFSHLCLLQIRYDQLTCAYVYGHLLNPLADWPNWSFHPFRQVDLTGSMTNRFPIDSHLDIYALFPCPIPAIQLWRKYYQKCNGLISNAIPIELTDGESILKYVCPVSRSYKW